MEMTGVFHGLPTRAIASRHLTVEYLAKAGPRLVGLRLAGRPENLLAETPDATWPTVFGTYHLYGGHRLWHAPEARPRSSMPDEGGLRVEDLADGIRLQGPVEVFTGIRKTIEIQVDPDRPALTLNHKLHNEGAWPVELAPWAITQLPFGGMAILPQPDKLVDPEGLTPNRTLAIWPYTHLGDGRLDLLRDDFYLVSAPGPAEPCKIGYFNQHGWTAFTRAGVILVKRFVPQPDRPHVDFGCNVEVFAGPVCLELETLGPLCRLEPNAEVEYRETWEIYADGRELPADLAALAVLAR